MDYLYKFHRTSSVPQGFPAYVTDLSFSSDRPSEEFSPELFLM